MYKNVCVWQPFLERVETRVDSVGVDLGLLPCRLIAGALLQVDDAELHLTKIEDFLHETFPAFVSQANADDNA